MEPENFPIGVLDSGVGGLTAVQEIQRQLPNENIIYFGDSKNMPYGNKSPQEIVGLTKKIISFLESHRVKAILLACNTISTQIDELVPLTDVPIFDIIYPGCLAAVENNTKNGVGLIATEATVKANAYGNTLHSLKPKIPFVANGSRDLARVIEKNWEDKDFLKSTIREAIDPIVTQHPIDNLILGCTHYPIVSKEINELYPDLRLINPAVKLVNIVKGYLEENDLLSTSSKSSLQIFTSGAMDNFLPFLDQLGIKNYDIKVQSLD